VVLAEGVSLQDEQKIIETLDAELKEKFGIEHTTLQIESASLSEKEMRL